MRKGGLWKSIFCFFVVIPMMWGTTVFAEEIKVPSQYSQIQPAIDAAAPGDVILVATGTYVGNLLVQKAITIKKEKETDHCTIDCGNDGGAVSRGVTFSGAEASGAVLSGFTITAGNGQGSGNWPGFGGAVLFQNNASATISDCVISGNTADFGGAIACIQSSPMMSHCVIEDNSAMLGGGVLSFDSSSPTIVACTITNNDANFGGGIYLDTEASPTIYDCLITNNSATLGGGGIAFFSMCSPSLVYCTLSGNIVSGGDLGGGGILSYYECSASITNSILWGNDAVNGPEIYLMGSSIAIDHSDVRVGVESENIYIDGSSDVEWGQGNIDEDPLFAAEGDYHLSPDSPCIDAGALVDDTPEFDIEGDPRVVGSAPDMGADEFFQEESEQTIDVVIDVKPGCSQNKINLKSWGLLPVAVKTTKDFNVRDIDPGTVEFAGARPVWRMCYDVDRDRDKDMLLFFRIKSLDLGENSAEATLTGKTKEGKSFTGKDKVTIEKPKCKAKAWRFGKRR